MKIPSGVDLQLKTDGGIVELHITAAITKKAAAAELCAAIRQLSGALESEKRPRKHKIAAVG